MKPVSIRERLHLIVDALPGSAINEIYFLLNTNYSEIIKKTLLQETDDFSKTEVDLMLQQYLA